ncbi:MAG: leucine-rich repeat domain-containing protein [Deltaproteobacteria bacterium]|nr:leucine-rich repeat domain-containing protein [Deltaproteobacteria bacterium]
MFKFLINCIFILVLIPVVLLSCDDSEQTGGNAAKEQSGDAVADDSADTGSQVAPDTGSQAFTDSENDAEAAYHELIASLGLPPCDGVIDFPDPAMEAAVRRNIGNPLGSITVRLVKDISGLGAASEHEAEAPIVDLTGIHCLPKLQEVDLRFNQVEDATPLIPLRHLVWLQMDGNNVSDTAPFAQMDSVTGLVLSNNHIDDLTYLAKMASLDYLDVNHNQISDVSPLANAQKLREMQVVDNPINDFSPLVTCTALEYVSIDASQVDCTSEESLEKFKLFYEAVRVTPLCIEEMYPAEPLEDEPSSAP